MFTGIVGDVGVIQRVERTAAGLELRVSCGFGMLEAGESISVNGACLTVREHGSGWFSVAAAGPTLDRTAIGDWSVGRRVNLERALKVGDRMGGHIVQGHVDAVGVVGEVEKEEGRWLVSVALPPELDDLLVRQGSITLDGVSLTVNALPAPAVVQVSLIEYTLAHTTLGDLAPGERVHVECDVIGKYVQRLIAPYLQQEIG